jgi:nitroimidazol reductase NimA-like FMN-containing flavoprotein (pyridoxamine 5'-phosphate oxidase superfamily)
MDINKKDFYKQIQAIAGTTHFAVLATERDGFPYTNIIGYLLDDDLKSLYFFTSSHTRKFRNIQKNPFVAILMDNREIYPDKTSLITAVTMLGKANIIEKDDKHIRQRYLAGMLNWDHLQNPPLTNLSRSIFLNIL